MIEYSCHSHLEELQMELEILSQPGTENIEKEETLVAAALILGGPRKP